MRRSPHRAIAGISELDSRVDLIARATPRPEHNDDILTPETAPDDFQDPGAGAAVRARR